MVWRRGRRRRRGIRRRRWIWRLLILRRILLRRVRLLILLRRIGWRLDNPAAGIAAAVALVWRLLIQRRLLGIRRAGGGGGARLCRAGPGPARGLRGAIGTLRISRRNFAPALRANPREHLFASLYCNSGRARLTTGCLRTNTFARPLRGRAGTNETPRTALGAQVRRVDSPGRYPGFDNCLPILLRQIDVDSPFAVRTAPPLQAPPRNNTCRFPARLQHVGPPLLCRTARAWLPPRAARCPRPSRAILHVPRRRRDVVIHQQESECNRPS